MSIRAILLAWWEHKPYYSGLQNKREDNDIQITSVVLKKKVMTITAYQTNLNVDISKYQR